jgi:hypothetical protein
MGAIAVALAVMIIAGTLPAFCSDDVEVIDARAMGTSTQMGKAFNLKIRIFQYSTPEDRQTLMSAFTTGQNAGLTKALSKMKPVGRISTPGTVGYEIAYARLIDTPTGRKVRFVTNRRMTMGEAYSNSTTMAYSLTAGEIDLNDKEKGKSTGMLFPAAQFIINKEGELQIELNKNPWKLVNITDWNKGKKD